MGSEWFYGLGATIGFVWCINLVYRSLRGVTRPYALPTLVFSLCWAALRALTMRPEGHWGVWLFFFFVVSATVFELHAYAIRWLLGRKQ